MSFKSWKCSRCGITHRVVNEPISKMIWKCEVTGCEVRYRDIKSRENKTMMYVSKDDKCLEYQETNTISKKPSISETTEAHAQDVK